MVCLARHGAAEPVAVVGSDPLKERRRRDEGGVRAKVEEFYIDGAGGNLVTVLVSEGAGCGVEIDGGIAVLLGLVGRRRRDGGGLKQCRLLLLNQYSA